MKLARRLCLWGFVLLTACIFGDTKARAEAWYQESLERLIEAAQCRVAGEDFILTPNYFVAWCQQKPDRRKTGVECLEPSTEGAQEGQLAILACREVYETLPQDGPSFDLIVLTAETDHPWRACPELIELALYDALPLWIEREPKPYGETFSLSEFWVAKNIFEDHEMVVSDALASGLALLYGGFGAGQILYCHEGRWVMAGYH